MRKRTLLIEPNDPVFDIKNEGIAVAGFGSYDRGYDYYVESVTVSAFCQDGLPFVVNIQIADNETFSVQSFSPLTMGNGIFSIPVNSIFRASTMELKIIAPTGGINTGRTIIVSNFIVGRKFAQLSQFTENNVILSIGDSIDVLSSYVTRVQGHRNFTMLKNLRNSGYDCRLASLAISGKSLNQFVAYFKAGYGIIRKADVILIQHGANDIGQNVSDLTFTQNLQYLKDFRNENYPQAKLVIVKVGPSNTNGIYATDGALRNTRQGQLNTLIDNFILSNINNNCFTIDCFTNFPTSAGNWADGVHFSQAGHDILGERLTLGMKSILGLS